MYTVQRSLSFHRELSFRNVRPWDNLSFATRETVVRPKKNLVRVALFRLVSDGGKKRVTDVSTSVKIRHGRNGQLVGGASDRRGRKRTSIIIDELRTSRRKVFKASKNFLDRTSRTGRIFPSPRIITEGDEGLAYTREPRQTRPHTIRNIYRM